MNTLRHSPADALRRIKASGILLASTATFALLAAIPDAGAQTNASLTVLHAFNGAPSDGAAPEASLIQGTDGNFYGTTYYGGSGTAAGAGNGTIYRVTSTGVLTTLYNFNGTDGSTPFAPLIQAADGNFYGVTYAGGANGDGTVFSITASGVLTTLYSFSGSDGLNPGGGLIQGSDGNFYGTTSSGGANGSGTIFRIDAGGKFVTLHQFDFTEADRPFAALTQGSDGNFYGTATSGGANGKGAVFQCTPTGALTVLHSFATTDGAQPYAPLLLARDGNFYSATIGGGANNDGTLFEISPAGVFAVLHDFAGTEGDGPVAGLLQGSDGNFYGVSESGGSSGGGTFFQFTPAGVLTVLHNFAGRDGISPEATPVLGNDGNFYGATTFGGGGGSGTVYQLNPNGSPGILQFTSAVSSISEGDGRVSLSVSRAGGSIGAVSVAYATSDGSAVAGTDYTAANGTLSWADGDTTDKILTVSILDRNLSDGGSKTFSVVLSEPSGGASLGTANSALVSILYDDTAPQPTVEITSPPANITVVSGSSLALSAAVTDPAGTLSQVQFFINDVFYSKSSSSKGPFTLNAVAPLPGTYVLKAVAIDNQNRQNVSTRTVTVVAPDPANPTPMADFVSDLNGRSLGGGTTVVLATTADSLSTDGTPLQRVDFFADNTLIASYDGQGKLLAGGTDGVGGVMDSGRRMSADTSNVAPAKNGTVFMASWAIPNLNKLVNLITVATTQSGLSQVSAPLTVRTAATSATSNHPPTTAIRSVANGQRVHKGTTITVPVDVSDPDASASGTSSIKTGGNARRLHVFGAPGSAIASMDYYLNKLKVASATQPPFTYDVTPPAAGTYVLEAIATDDAGLSGVAPPVTFQVVGTPVITLSLPGVDDGTANTTVAEGGPKLKILVTRSGDDLSEDVTVNYKAGGSAVSGVDYKTLTNSVTIPAGAASVKIKVNAFDDGVADGSKLLKLKLSADGSYDLGTPAKAKITILDVEGQ